MGILGLIMVMLFSIFEQINKAWLQSENRVETFTQARAILDLMSRELSQAVVSPKITFYGKDANDVYFIAPVNTTTNVADLCEVGYVFDPNLFTLTRCLTLSDNTRWDFYASPAAWWRTFDTTKDAVLATATNILNLSFQYLDINGNAIPYGAPANKLPYSIVISLDAVDSRTAARLALVPNVGTAWLPITNSTLRSFSTTVYLPNLTP